AETWYGRPAARLDLVGVTGTNGKTTSVTLLRHVLSALEPMGSIGTLGAFDPAGEPVPSEAGNLTTPGPIDLQATLAALVERGPAPVAGPLQRGERARRGGVRLGSRRARRNRGRAADGRAPDPGTDGADRRPAVYGAARLRAHAGRAGARARDAAAAHHRPADR